MSTHKITHRSTIPFPCWLWRSLDMSDINYQRKPEWVWKREEFYSAAYILSNGFTHYSTNPPDQPPLGEPAPEGSLPVTEPASPSLQSVAEEMIKDVVASCGGCNFAGDVDDGVSFIGKAVNSAITRHFAPVYAALTERDERIGRLEKELADVQKGKIDACFAWTEAQDEITALRTRCEALEKERDEARESVDYYRAQANRKGLECVELCTRCEELQRDKERLEHLAWLCVGNSQTSAGLQWSSFKALIGDGYTFRDALDRDIARRQGLKASAARNQQEKA